MSRRMLRRGISGLGVFAVMCSGASVPAHAGANLVFSSPLLDFGSVVVDTAVERSVTLTNTGDTPFTPYRFDFQNYNGPVFVHVGKSTCARNVVIPAGGSCGLVLYAFPNTLKETLEGSMWVVDNSETRAATLALVGKVVSPPPPPDDPKRASREILPGNRTQVSWSPVSAASSFEVQSSGRVVCTAGAGQTSCVTDKAFGPRVGVWVMAKSDSGVSDGVEAKYRAPESPVAFAAIRFAGRTSSLSKAARADATAAGKGLAKQGFYKDITVVAGTKSGRAVGAARAQAVRGVILARYAPYPDLETPTVGTAVRGGGNGVKITVG